MKNNLILKTRIQLASIAILVIFALSLILSQSASPDFSPFFALKRVQEKVYLNFKGSPSERVNYMSSLLDRRLDELSSMVKRQSYCCILASALRYSATAGQITEMIEANNIKGKVPAIIDQLQNHKKVLQELYVIYPKNTENMEYKYIEDDINYLDLYLDKLSKIK